MLRLYETVFVMDSQLEQSKIEVFSDKIQKIITDSGGTIQKVDYWGKRRLSYPIKKKQYGYYVCILFESDGKVVGPIERVYRLDESVFRFLTIRLSKRAIRRMRLDQEKNRKEIAKVPEAETVVKKEDK